jgi:hypothetical protein
VDEVNTTDLESDYQARNQEIDDLGEDTGFLRYLDENRINLARAFLGYKGGYTVRKLKKFYKQFHDGVLNEETG